MQGTKMGRVKSSAEGPLMKAQEVAMFLLNSCRSLQEFESFMFGSSLRGVGSDFDILIVGPSGEPLSRLKAEIKFAGEKLPLDVLYMLPTEAAETEFVVREGCVPLAQLAYEHQASQRGTACINEV
jgi:hypothetical protein